MDRSRSGQQRVVELPIEHGGLGFLLVKDLAAIARLSALASLPENSERHSFREAVINKEGLDLETRLQPKMETPPREIVGNCMSFLLDVVQRQSPGTLPNPTSPRALRVPGCMLITLSRSSGTAGCALLINMPSKRDKEHQAWATGSTLFHSSIRQNGEWSIQMGVATPFWAHVAGSRAKPQEQ